MVDAVYQAVVKETFETKPLRTVLMIDDEFPTLADLASGKDDSKKFAQTDRAVALYEGFRSKQMVCDVENHFEEVHTDRIRKSDLIILDYNLGPAEGDIERAINILRRLAESKHFNTVVVYTANPDQNEVWLEIMASLVGGWDDLPAGLQGDAQVHWDRLTDAGTLPTATKQAVMQYVRRSSIRDLSEEVRRPAQEELVKLGVPGAACGEIITAMIHKELSRRAGVHAGAPARRAIGGFADGVRWVQSRNSFVAILQKNDLTEDRTDPGGIMAGLSRALLAWQPNLFQILISEIQNILELEALATEDVHLREPETHTGFWYYLLDSLGKIDIDADPDIKGPLGSIVDKIVDGIRRRLSSDADLLLLGSNAVKSELRAMAWTDETWPQRGKNSMFAAATTLARTDGQVKTPDVIFRLNSFLGTERFRRAHLTTGTVFRHAATDTFWVSASPACDLVARRPSDQQAWANAIHPMTPLVAVLLFAENDDGPLNHATQSRHIFLETPDGKRTFRLVNGVGQPAYEFFFAENEGRVRDEAGRTLFEATRLTENGEARQLVSTTFEVVGQLRGLNATRVLQMAGQHLSRIGLDNIDLPVK